MWNVNYYGLGTIETILLILWQIIAVVQGLMAYGTAYRKAKANGDNGVSLWGWLIVYDLAAVVPFLGYYLWKKNRE